MIDLSQVFELIFAYIYRISLLTKGDLIDHVYKLKSTLNNMKKKRLKCTIEESLFRYTKIKYLGFWLTRDGIKPIDKN